MNLHIDFEKVQKHKDVKLLELQGNTIPALKVEKDKEKQYTGTIILDSITRFEGIPLQAFDYKLGSRSPIEWVLEQHKPQKYSKADIKNYAKVFDLFNTPEQEYKRYVNIIRSYLIDLIPRLATVCIETLILKKKIQQLEEKNSKKTT